MSRLRLLAILGAAIGAQASPSGLSSSDLASGSLSARASPNYICGAECGKGGLCNTRPKRSVAEEVVPTLAATATLEDDAITALEKRNLMPASNIKDVDKYVIQNLKDPATEDLPWQKHEAVAKYHDFGAKAFNKMIWGIHGCTAIVIASEKGVWISHFMETGLMPDAGRAQDRARIDTAIQNGHAHYEKPAALAADGGPLSKAAKPHIYVSASCVHTNNACDKDANGQPVFEHARTNQLLNTLFGPNTPFSGVPIVKRGYIRPQTTDENEFQEITDKTARGKVLVQYDNNQKSDDFMPVNPKQASYRVWLEHTPYQERWVATQCQGGNAPGQKRDASCPLPKASPSASHSKTASSRASTTTKPPHATTLKTSTTTNVKPTTTDVTTTKADTTKATTTKATTTTKAGHTKADTTKATTTKATTTKAKTTKATATKHSSGSSRKGGHKKGSH